MTIEIRNARPGEYGAVVEALATGFLERPDVARATEAAASTWAPDRTWAAFDAGRVCGTFRSWATELTLPGGRRVPASAIAAVSVLPTHRRRGILSRMAAAEHAAIRARGESVALLHASEYPIYGRFGYGPACRVATWTLDAHVTAFHGPDAGGIELVPPGAAAREAMKAVFDAWRVRQAGEIRRGDERWDEELGLRPSPWGDTWKGLLALRRDATGLVDGYVRYRAEQRWEERQPRANLRVDELHALSDEAYGALWRFLAATDLVATVTAERRSPSERLPWLLTNARAAVASDVGDSLWMRVFDLPAVLEARAYERTGAMTIEVVDQEATQPGRVALDASPDGARCAPTDRLPDLTLPVAALGAAGLAGTRLRDAVRATGCDEHRPGALARADALLATLDEPWCSTMF